MWVLRGFDRDTEELVAEVELTDVPPAVDRELWDLPPADLGYDSYPATGERFALLRPYARGDRLNPHWLDFFLEYDASR